MHVVPGVVDGNVLGVHVGFVDLSGGGEPVLGFGVVAGAVEDVAGHVDHVAGAGREGGELFGGVDGALGMIAGLHGVDPVMVEGGVVGMGLEGCFENFDGLLGAGERIAFVVVAVEEGLGEEDLRLGVVAVFGDGFAPEGYGGRFLLVIAGGFLAGLGWALLGGRWLR